MAGEVVRDNTGHRPNTPEKPRHLKPYDEHDPSKDNAPGKPANQTTDKSENKSADKSADKSGDKATVKSDTTTKIKSADKFGSSDLSEADRAIDLHLRLLAETEGRRKSSPANGDKKVGDYAAARVLASPTFLPEFDDFPPKSVLDKWDNDNTEAAKDIATMRASGMGNINQFNQKVRKIADERTTNDFLKNLTSNNVVTEEVLTDLVAKVGGSMFKDPALQGTADAINPEKFTPAQKLLLLELVANEVKGSAFAQKLFPKEMQDSLHANRLVGKDNQNAINLQVYRDLVLEKDKSAHPLTPDQEKVRAAAIGTWAGVRFPSDDPFDKLQAPVQSNLRYQFNTSDAEIERVRAEVVAARTLEKTLPKTPAALVLEKLPPKAPDDLEYLKRKTPDEQSAWHTYRGMKTDAIEKLGSEKNAEIIQVYKDLFGFKSSWDEIKSGKGPIKGTQALRDFTGRQASGIDGLGEVEKLYRRYRTAVDSPEQKQLVDKLRKAEESSNADIDWGNVLLPSVLDKNIGWPRIIGTYGAEALLGYGIGYKAIAKPLFNSYASEITAAYTNGTTKGLGWRLMPNFVQVKSAQNAIETELKKNGIFSKGATINISEPKNSKQVLKAYDEVLKKYKGEKWLTTAAEKAITDKRDSFKPKIEEADAAKRIPEIAKELTGSKDFTHKTPNSRYMHEIELAHTAEEGKAKPDLEKCRGYEIYGERIKRSRKADEPAITDAYADAGIEGDARKMLSTIAAEATQSPDLDFATPNEDFVKTIEGCETNYRNRTAAARGTVDDIRIAAYKLYAREVADRKPEEPAIKKAYADAGIEAAARRKLPDMAKEMIASSRFSSLTVNREFVKIINDAATAERTAPPSGTTDNVKVAALHLYARQVAARPEGDIAMNAALADANIPEPKSHEIKTAEETLLKGEVLDHFTRPGDYTFTNEDIYNRLLAVQKTEHNDRHPPIKANITAVDKLVEEWKPLGTNENTKGERGYLRLLVATDPVMNKPKGDDVRDARIGRSGSLRIGEEIRQASDKNTTYEDVAGQRGKPGIIDQIELAELNGARSSARLQAIADLRQYFKGLAATNPNGSATRSICKEAGTDNPPTVKEIDTAYETIAREIKNSLFRRIHKTESKGAVLEAIKTAMDMDAKKPPVEARDEAFTKLLNDWGGREGIATKDEKGYGLLELSLQAGDKLDQNQVTKERENLVRKIISDPKIETLTNDQVRRLLEKEHHNEHSVTTTNLNRLEAIEKVIADWKPRCEGNKGPQLAKAGLYEVLGETPPVVLPKLNEQKKVFEDLERRAARPGAGTWQGAEARLTQWKNEAVAAGATPGELAVYDEVIREAKASQGNDRANQGQAKMLEYVRSRGKEVKAEIAKGAPSGPAPIRTEDPTLRAKNAERYLKQGQALHLPLNSKTVLPVTDPSAPTVTIDSTIGWESLIDRVNTDMKLHQPLAGEAPSDYYQSLVAFRKECRDVRGQGLSPTEYWLKQIDPHAADRELYLNELKKVAGPALLTAGEPHKNPGDTDSFDTVRNELDKIIGPIRRSEVRQHMEQVRDALVQNPANPAQTPMQRIEEFSQNTPSYAVSNQPGSLKTNSVQEFIWQNSMAERDPAKAAAVVKLDSVDPADKNKAADYFDAQASTLRNGRQKTALEDIAQTLRNGAGTVRHGLLAEDGFSTAADSHYRTRQLGIGSFLDAPARTTFSQTMAGIERNGTELQEQESVEFVIDTLQDQLAKEVDATKRTEIESKIRLLNDLHTEASSTNRGRRQIAADQIAEVLKACYENDSLALGKIANDAATEARAKAAGSNVSGRATGLLIFAQTITVVLAGAVAAPSLKRLYQRINTPDSGSIQLGPG